MKSRSFTLVDVPDPKNLNVEFVYNFFVNDEKINDSGDMRIAQNPEYLQNLVSANSLQAEVPRYVTIEFEPAILSFNNYLDSANQNINFTNFLEKIDSEETITNSGFASIRESDKSAKTRAKQKVEALSKIFGISFSDSEQSKKIAEYLGVNQETIQSLISPLNDPSKFFVNQLSKYANFSPDVFDLASSCELSSQINKRLIGPSVNGADDTSPLSKIRFELQAKEKSKNYSALASAGTLSVTDIEPVIQPIAKVSTEKDVKLLGATVVGYIIQRQHIDDNGVPISGRNKTFYLRGQNNTRYLDTQVLYGTSYLYSVRSVVRVDAILDEGDQNSQVAFLVASRLLSSSVRTEEYAPPNEPDGVFYNFNYDAERGLIVRWQIPSGRSRDVKYFQVFRRKTIFEPFVCIAQLDFDDSVLRTVLREQVRKDRIFYNPAGPITFFEDKNFNRDSKYIYAVVAIDAHGYSSGYSVQTEVGFDKIKNSLILKMISRAGAPKQYPNFYVDPRLDDNIAVDSFAQDALLDSGHKKFDVYFTPDARIVKTADGLIQPVFLTDQADVAQSAEQIYGTSVSADDVDTKGSYFLHFINVDVQKSAQVKIGIADLRKNSL